MSNWLQFSSNLPNSEQRKDKQSVQLLKFLCTIYCGMKVSINRSRFSKLTSLLVCSTGTQLHWIQQNNLSKNRWSALEFRRSSLWPEKCGRFIQEEESRQKQPGQWAVVLGPLIMKHMSMFGYEIDSHWCRTDQIYDKIPQTARCPSRTTAGSYLILNMAIISSPHCQTHIRCKPVVYLPVTQHCRQTPPGELSWAAWHPAVSLTQRDQLLTGHWKHSSWKWLTHLLMGRIGTVCLQGQMKTPQ